MRREVERLAALLLALAGGCATAPPVRLAVHVDTLDPDQLSVYEAARVRYAAALCARGLDDQRGLFLKVGDRTYYSVARFGRYSELDRLYAETKRVDAKMGDRAREYFSGSDGALVFPHANEIWRERPELGYAASARGLGDALTVVIEDVDPKQDYGAVWRPIAQALAKARYPIERRTWFSATGTGRYLSFWLAPSRALLQTAPTVDQALATAVGSERANELLRAWHAIVLRGQTLEVTVKPEMNLPCATRAGSAARP